jgi:hypothetical protein
MNYRVRFALVILATFAVPALASGNGEMIAGRTALHTGKNRADKFRIMNTVYPSYVIAGRAGARAAQISARGQNPKSARASCSDHGRAKRFNPDKTLEVPQAIDRKSSEPAGDEANAVHEKYHDDLQLEPPGEAKGASQGFPGIAHRLRTRRDYEDQANYAPAATVCIASQWWWTSGAAVCTPIASSPQVTHRGPL